MSDTPTRGRRLVHKGCRSRYGNKLNAIVGRISHCQTLEIGIADDRVGWWLVRQWPSLSGGFKYGCSFKTVLWFDGCDGERTYPVQLR